MDEVESITIRDKILGLRVFILFSALLTAEIIPLLLFEKLLATEQRSALWRLVAQHNCKIFLKLWGVQLTTVAQPQHSSPVIYTCNHPSMIDGFILFGLLGSNVIALTAPFTSFGFPFNYWFKQMGFIDIQRDKDDVFNHPTANTREQAFRKLFNYLTEGKSLLIFPEGHVERAHQLHYVHTGVARISLQAKVPVQVMTLSGMEQVYLNNFALRRGQLTVRFGRCLEPPAVSHYVPFRKVVPFYAKDMERSLVAILPLRYLPEYYQTVGQGVAAFVDIDHTLYEGYSQKDFVRYLLKHKYVSRTLPLKALWWIMLEKMQLMPHHQLMRQSLGLLKGLSVKEVDQWCDDFFKDIAVHKINHHLMPNLKDHLAQNHIVILVSEAIHPLAKLFKEYVKASVSLDTVLQKRAGHYTGTVERLNYHFTKAELVEKFAHDFGIDLKKSYAYTDSINDLPLLYSVRHKMVVNPDKKLRPVAQQQRWQVL
ncbi:MAG: HAD-IB family hydrolase [Candidatus Kerfeldbacteria bacterium]|nr:HAD-IB family hydrolase [Candidatus Kerfeldbacteria bacterium]